jgi:Leucine-rich repeat (LRR) protein
MIAVIYSNNSKINYNTFEEIKNSDNVIELACSLDKQSLSKVANEKHSFSLGSYKNLIKLPEKMDFPKLVHLDISYNKITELPNLFFPELEYFNCSGNHIESLPELKFPKLKCFNASNNKIKLLPEEFDFPELLELNITDNYIKLLPKINSPKLVILDCSENELIELPKELNFEKLEELLLSDNKIKELPDNMILPNLEIFYCSYNNLKSLPDMDFKKLKEFDCGNNELKSLPKLNIPKIIIFDFGSNKLESLPNMNYQYLEELLLSDNKIKELPDNMILPNLEIFNCSYNNLKSLPDMDFKKLKEFDCSHNKLKSLPDMDWSNLEMFDCSYNNLKSVSDIIIKCPNLVEFDCSHNKLKSLPDMNFINLIVYKCRYNKLISLSDNINCPNLEIFECNYNMLTKLPDNMILPELESLICSHNQLKQFPLCILNFNTLYEIDYKNNPIELSPQIARFIKRIRNGTIKNLNVYNDNQNVHNSTIQLSVKKSINNITTRTDLPKFNKDELYKIIINDDIISKDCKEQLIQYSSDNSEHSLLLLTFGEVLWYVLQTIENDFKDDDKKEIKTILNQEMKDAECKCFTGRMNRIVNCLNGFSKLVCINIQDSEQIGNIIFIIKEKLEKENNYSIEKHKHLVIQELVERGYDKDTINIWIEYIE